MRNVWIIISGLAVGVAIGWSVYYFFLKQSDTSNVSLLSSLENYVPVLANENPLLTANVGQLDKWIPFYPIQCGEIVFEKADPKDKELYFSFCIGEIKSRVALETGHQLSNDEILNPRVKAHWHEVMESKYHG